MTLKRTDYFSAIYSFCNPLGLRTSVQRRCRFLHSPATCCSEGYASATESRGVDIRGCSVGCGADAVSRDASAVDAEVGASMIPFSPSGCAKFSRPRKRLMAGWSAWWGRAGVVAGTFAFSIWAICRRYARMIAAVAAASS